MAAPGGGADDRLPATVEGLFRAPCDPVVLGVRPDGRFGPFGACLDWRLAGRLARHVARSQPTAGAPLLVPGSPLLPAPRFLLVAAATPLVRLVETLAGLGATSPGLCPEEFGWTPAEVVTAFAPATVVVFDGAVR